MERANSAVRRGESDAYRSMTQIALAMTLHHLINHLLCQGTAAARQFLDRKAGSEDVEKKSTKNLLRDARIRSLRKSLAEIGEIHSKVGAVRRLVRDRLRRDEEARIIIFATFRDSVGALEKALTGLLDCRPIQFIGQSRKSSAGGLTPKQQVARIEEFRSGSANVLIATSVGEEGLDIPTADLVIFYEPVPSEIRTIQRRGRTGRHRDGDVVVLIAEDTRDEGARAAALRKEENMHRAVSLMMRMSSQQQILSAPFAKNIDPRSLRKIERKKKLEQPPQRSSHPRPSDLEDRLALSSSRALRRKRELPPSQAPKRRIPMLGRRPKPNLSPRTNLRIQYRLPKTSSHWRNRAFQTCRAQSSLPMTAS